MRKQLWMTGEEGGASTGAQRKFGCASDRCANRSCVCLYKQLNLVKCLKITVMCLCKEFPSSIEGSYS